MFIATEISKKVETISLGLGNLSKKCQLQKMSAITYRQATEISTRDVKEDAGWVIIWKILSFAENSWWNHGMLWDAVELVIANFRNLIDSSLNLNTRYKHKVWLDYMRLIRWEETTIKNSLWRVPFHSWIRLMFFLKLLVDINRMCHYPKNVSRRIIFLDKTLRNQRKKYVMTRVSHKFHS